MSVNHVERGRYVFLVAGCDTCHSPRDWTRFGGPVIPSLHASGVEFPSDLKLTARVASANITSDPETGIGAWTDGEKIRAIRDGIGRDGRALYPLMPYRRYRNMSDEDVDDLVAYLNTLAPVRHHVPRPQMSLPVALRVKDRPHPAGSVPPPDRHDVVRYGAYLTNLAGCAQCHTAASNGRGLQRKRLAGGRRISLNGLSVVSANISPDSRSGLGRWSEQEFLDRMYLYRDFAEKGSPKVGPENFTVMPWLAFSSFEPADLKAIYAYLQTRKPVFQMVTAHPLPDNEE